MTNERKLSPSQIRALGGALIDGIMTGNVEIVRNALQRGARADTSIYRNKKTAPAFHWAMTAFNRDIAELLAKNAPSIDIRTETGETALFFAIECQNIEAVRFLMEHGADPLAEDQYGLVALGKARALPTSDTLRVPLLEALLAIYPAKEKPANDALALQCSIPAPKPIILKNTKPPEKGFSL